MASFDDSRHSRAEIIRRGAALLVGAWGLRAGMSPPAARAASVAETAAAEPRLVVRDEPLPGRAARRPSGLLHGRETPEFTMVGLHWRGAGHVLFRTRSLDGRWSAWLRAAMHEAADPTETGPSRGWHLGTPVWTGESDAIEYRIVGRVSRLRAHFIWSPPFEVDAGRGLLSADRPLIITRAAWGANERIVRARPRYASRLFLAIVHHTAGPQPATPAQSAAIVRAIQLYHVKANGWNDIGYNFLVDRFGQIFEGRGGGMSRNVIGAHARGFNTGSTGVAVLGNFQRTRESASARRALQTLLAWRLDVAHIDPLERVEYLSGGRLRRLRAISGHRDVNPTDCPGSRLYADLGSLAVGVAAQGLPKIYDPHADASVAGSARFTARLSGTLRWKVTVLDADGEEVGAGSGRGDAIDWTWFAGSAAGGRYRYRIEAGAARPAAGSFRLRLVPGRRR